MFTCETTKYKNKKIKSELELSIDTRTIQFLPHYSARNLVTADTKRINFRCRTQNIFSLIDHLVKLFFLIELDTKHISTRCCAGRKNLLIGVFHLLDVCMIYFSRQAYQLSWLHGSFVKRLDRQSYAVHFDWFIIEFY